MKIDRLRDRVYSRAGPLRGKRREGGNKREKEGEREKALVQLA